MYYFWVDRPHTAVTWALRILLMMRHSTRFCVQCTVQIWTKTWTWRLLRHFRFSRHFFSFYTWRKEESGLLSLSSVMQLTLTFTAWFCTSPPLPSIIPTFPRKVSSHFCFHPLMTVGYWKIFILAGKILNENGYLIIHIRAINQLNRVTRHTLSCPPPPGWRAHAWTQSRIILDHGASGLNKFFAHPPAL
jgi:hypothetical protein